MWVSRATASRLMVDKEVALERPLPTENLVIAENGTYVVDARNMRIVWDLVAAR